MFVFEVVRQLTCFFPKSHKKFHFNYVSPLKTVTFWGILDRMGTKVGQNIRFVPKMSRSLTVVH